MIYEELSMRSPHPHFPPFLLQWRTFEADLTALALKSEKLLAGRWKHTFAQVLNISVLLLCFLSVSLHDHSCLQKRQQENMPQLGFVFSMSRTVRNGNCTVKCVYECACVRQREREHSMSWMQHVADVDLI